MNIRIVSMCALTLIVIGAFGYLVLPGILGTHQISTTVRDASVPDSSQLLLAIETSLGNKPVSWSGNKVKAAAMASDLVQVCVDAPNTGEFAIECDTFEYWTNNRSGKWELLGSFADGQEGFSTCAQWEDMRVAKGMKCLRGTDHNSTVTY